MSMVKGEPQKHVTAFSTVRDRRSVVIAIWNTTVNCM